MRVYLIRHGQSISNLQRIISGQIDTTLSELGKKQAFSLQSVLPDHYDRVYSSTLSRAIETAKIALDVDDSNTIISLDELREIGFGNLEGEDRDNLPVDEDSFFKFAWLQEDTFQGRGGVELHEDFFERTHTIFDQIVQDAEEKDEHIILVFCHGGVMKSILEMHLGLSEGGFKNTEVAILEKIDDSWVLQQLRDHILTE